MTLEKYLPDFKIITQRNADEMIDHDEDFDEYADAMVEEQEHKLSENGIDYLGTGYMLHFFDSVFFDDKIRFDEIHEAIQCLAIKDGYDLVKFENGNLGYVAYYNGHLNGFEILTSGDTAKDKFTELVESRKIDIEDFEESGAEFYFDDIVYYDDWLNTLVNEL